MINQSPLGSVPGKLVFGRVRVAGPDGTLYTYDILEHEVPWTIYGRAWQHDGEQETPVFDVAVRTTSRAHLNARRAVRDEVVRRLKLPGETYPLPGYALP